MELLFPAFVYICRMFVSKGFTFLDFAHIRLVALITCHKTQVGEAVVVLEKKSVL